MFCVAPSNREGFIVTAAIPASAMILHLWQRHTAVTGNTQIMGKAITRNGWKTAQSLMDKTMAIFQQGRILPTPLSVPPPAGAMSPPPTVTLLLLALVWCQHPIYGGPHMMPTGPTPGMRPLMGGHMPVMPGPPVVGPPARPMWHPIGQEWLNHTKTGEAS